MFAVLCHWFCQCICYPFSPDWCKTFQVFLDSRLTTVLALGSIFLLYSHDFPSIESWGYIYFFAKLSRILAFFFGYSVGINRHANCFYKKIVLNQIHFPMLTIMLLMRCLEDDDDVWLAWLNSAFSFFQYSLDLIQSFCRHCLYFSGHVDFLYSIDVFLCSGSFFLNVSLIFSRHLLQ